MSLILEIDKPDTRDRRRLSRYMRRWLTAAVPVYELGRLAKAVIYGIFRLAVTCEMSCRLPSISKSPLAFAGRPAGMASSRQTQ